MKLLALATLIVGIIILFGGAFELADITAANTAARLEGI